ncbi:MAG TPA: thiamine biosynthesis protein ThiS [Deltaproteobacteria bacterium]|jgi:sulfur carrier protein|nr:thiamine biosynthesis protein ThiS [Deltaproteobacteria bacterium]
MRSQGLSEETLSIRVNGDLRPLAGGSTIADLLNELGLGARRMAIAVNRCVIPRSRYGEHLLEAGDRVEILEAVGGG